MNRTTLLLVVALAAACSSSDYDQPRDGGRGPRGGGRTGMMAPRPADGTGLLPPAGWWHDPQLAGAVNVTADQYTALEALEKNQTTELTKLRGDVTTASRDLRLLLETEKPSSNDIITAGNRVQSIRGEIFSHELRMLADERAILTQQQWTTLQKQLENERAQDRGGYGRDRDGYGGRRGGRGGWGRPPGSGGVWP
jgi:hypothetical protein